MGNRAAEGCEDRSVTSYPPPVRAQQTDSLPLVLLQYQGTIANLPKSLEPSIERSGTLIATFQPESDLTALIERYRTGPFRPDPQVYESVSHDESDVVFGIDLRKWAEGGWSTIMSGEEQRDTIPAVVTALLSAMKDAYSRIPDDAGKYFPLSILSHTDHNYGLQRRERHGFMRSHYQPSTISARH